MRHHDRTLARVNHSRSDRHQRPKADARNTPNSPTATTLANAAPIAFDMLFATPRRAPTAMRPCRFAVTKRKRAGVSSLQCSTRGRRTSSPLEEYAAGSAGPVDGRHS